MARFKTTFGKCGHTVEGEGSIGPSHCTVCPPPVFASEAIKRLDESGQAPGILQYGQMIAQGVDPALFQPLPVNGRGVPQQPQAAMPLPQQAVQPALMGGAYQGHYTPPAYAPSPPLAQLAQLAQRAPQPKAAPQAAPTPSNQDVLIDLMETILVLTGEINRQATATEQLAALAERQTEALERIAAAIDPPIPVYLNAKTVDVTENSFSIARNGASSPK